MNIAEKLTTIAENEQKIYDKGRYDEWSLFWETLQDGGKRTDYQYLCGRGSCWSKKTFKPKYDLNVVNGFNMFGAAIYYTNLDLREEILGVKLDTSNATTMHNFCSWSGMVTAFGTIDIRKTTDGADSVFAGANNLHTIEKLIIRAPDTRLIKFDYCTSLKNLTIEGTIGGNFNCSYAPLNVDSMKSVISCLKDYSGTESEGVYTLTLKDECKTALEAEGATSPNGNLWTEYVSDLGWVLA